MENEFAMTDLGRMKYNLGGIEVVQNDTWIFVSQNKYVVDVIERFCMRNDNMVWNPIVPDSRLSKEDNGIPIDATQYKQLVESLMYLTGTRSGLMFGVSLTSIYMERPTKTHMDVAKRILRYLNGNTELGYSKGTNVRLTGFSNSDYAGDVDDMNSTFGYVFMLGSGAISWSSKKHIVVTLSATEVEYIAAASCACQCVWLRRILEN